MRHDNGGRTAIHPDPEVALNRAENGRVGTASILLLLLVQSYNSPLDRERDLQRFLRGVFSGMSPKGEWILTIDNKGSSWQLNHATQKFRPMIYKLFV